MKNNKKGFTLAELLIVVAIIAVLVGISIPVFTSQLEKSREAVDMANIRAAYAEVMADAITNEGGTDNFSKPVKQKQTVANWATTPELPGNLEVDPPTATSGSWSVAVVKDTNGLVTGAKATYSAGE